MKARHSTATVLILAALVTGCGGNDDGTNTDSRRDTGDAGSLPVPEGARGGVTGMPNAPGPGGIGPAITNVDELAPDTAIDSDGNLMPPDASPDGAGTASIDGSPGISMPGSPGTGEPQALPGEPGPDEATAVVREYYGAINSDELARAYRLWSDGGSASGQSAQQFADGFANVERISVETMTPGRIDAGAGARYIEVPVAVTGIQRDGSTRRFVGAYTLRRSVVPGASPDQQQWRITSADIREVQQ